jgi:dTDP-D-glucose 4,6-dehydratase
LLDETADCKITNFDALTYPGNLDNLEGPDPERHRFVHGNIAESEAVLATLDENAYAIVN